MKYANIYAFIFVLLITSSGYFVAKMYFLKDVFNGTATPAEVGKLLGLRLLTALIVIVAAYCLF